MLTVNTIAQVLNECCLDAQTASALIYYRDHAGNLNVINGVRIVRNITDGKDIMTVELG